MAYSGANSSGSPPVLSSGSDEVLRMGEMKRKRMESNRESARRSRQRKQKHLSDLTAQITQLKQENNQVSNTINLTTQKFTQVESENSVLQAQMTELSQRLQSLHDILNFINSSTAASAGDAVTAAGNCMFEAEEFQLQGFGDGFWNSNPWNSSGINQHPIMASAEIFMDY